MFAVAWWLWMEQNLRIFKALFLSKQLQWDGITFLAPLWYNALGEFREVSLTCI